METSLSLNNTSNRTFKFNYLALMLVLVFIAISFLVLRIERLNPTTMAFESDSSVNANRGSHALRGWLGLTATEAGCNVQGWMSGNDQAFKSLDKDFDEPCSIKLATSVWEELVNVYKQATGGGGKYFDFIEEVSIEILEKIATMAIP